MSCWEHKASSFMLGWPYYIGEGSEIDVLER